MNIKHKSLGKKIFDVVNIAILTIASLICILPFVNLLAISLSESSAAAAGKVTFWPVDFTLATYKYIIRSDAFFTSFFVSIQRVIIGVFINLVLIILTAYPLSKSKDTFKKRGIYAWFFIVSMMFVPSFIPSYIIVHNLGIVDTMLALVLPGALPIFNVIVMLNFFRNLPTEIEEAAFIDGASHIRTLIAIHIPLSKAAIATISLFCIVNHWNSWFDGMIYMNDTANYPLQSYLRTVIMNPETLMSMMQNNSQLLELMSVVNNKTAKAAQLFIATIPVLIAYPFLQKYFTTGLVVGSVKG